MGDPLLLLARAVAYAPWLVTFGVGVLAGMRGASLYYKKELRMAQVTLVTARTQWHTLLREGRARELALGAALEREKADRGSLTRIDHRLQR